MAGINIECSGCGEFLCAPECDKCREEQYPVAEPEEENHRVDLCDRCHAKLVLSNKAKPQGNMRLIFLPGTCRGCKTEQVIHLVFVRKDADYSFLMPKRRQ